MCGFAGVIAWEDRYRTSRETLARMSARIAHRGPDGEGMWINHEEEVRPDRPQVALAHRRLAIIDLDERANQPFTDGEGRWIVFNGEIYNYRELRGELSRLQPDYPWRTSSDTEVLLRAYAQWSEKCVEHLNGMFAFAIWEEREQTLFLARDRMGQKPLYIVQSLPGAVEALIGAAQPSNSGVAMVAFASELPALIELPWLDTTIDNTAVLDYLRWGYSPDRCILAGVSQLLPGFWHRFRRDLWEPGLYFRPLLTEEASSPTHSPSVRDMVTRAVKRQLVADVPLGCFLSGGVDSSVVALAMKAAVEPSQPVLTFSIGFDDPRYDERRYAAEVARHLKTQHHEFVVRPNASEDLPRLAAAFGEPFGDSSALPTHYLARETRARVKVALSGDGGDELFGGYARYRAMRLEKVLPYWPHGVRSFLGTLGKTLSASHPKSRLSHVHRFLKTLHQPASQRYASYLRIFDDAGLTALFQEGSQALLLRSDEIAEQYHQLLDKLDPVQAALAVDRLTYLPGDLLTKVDRASMLHALEVRSPFMDHELVQFAAGLTTDQLLKGGPKRMLREAFAADLPEFVFKRRKMGFAVPIGEWFRGELRGMLREHLFAADSFAAGHFNRNVVVRLVEEHEQERVDHSQRLYALLMLELWWRGQRGGG